MNALVTGASGFTGSHLVRYLVATGWRVRALTRPGADLRPLAGLDVEHAHLDLGDDRPADDVVAGIDVVFHVAALYRTEGVPRRRFWQVNVGGTRKLLEAATRAGVGRFVHVSTVGVQGHIRRPPATEEAPFGPGDHYQESKRDAEILAREHFARTGLAGVVIRPTAIYGPGDTRFLKLFRLIDRGRFLMLGRGDRLYHMVYVDDLVRGLAIAGVHPGAVGEVFTIGGAEYVTLNDLVRRISAVLGRPVPRLRVPVAPVRAMGLLCEVACRPLRIDPPLHRRRVDFFTKDRAFDIRKARRLLGYEPTVSLDEGLARAAAWYRERGWLC
ncbi:MAG TPA: NAD-dependent epimerase/dehydratase family protein [Thermodesulfobacteriota bacterium]